VTTPTACRSWAGNLAKKTPWAPGARALADAARVLDAVLESGQSADRALGALESSQDRAAVRAIALGTMRWYLRLAPAIEGLLSHPAAVDPLTRALLAIGAHQIEYSRNAPEATVDAAVDAARLVGRTRATGLVNAVLRRFVAERASLLGRIDLTLAGRAAHPAWLVEEITAVWPKEGETILAANNEHPPMSLRVDLTRSSVADYLARLAAASIDAHGIQSIPSAVVLSHPMAVRDLPGFAEGIVSVQDAGAQLAAPLLDARPGMGVLDGCAAPGGKTGQLLEGLGESAHLTALDIDPVRVGLIRENLARLRREARLVVGDLRDPATFWDGRPFERILVDAPCSSTGVIRRHPDIKLLRRAADITAFAATQLAMLRAAVTLLAPGGRLLYSTCSVLAAENEQVVKRLLAAEPALTPISLAERALPPGTVPRGPGVQLLPGAEAGTDGFYYACLEKTTGGT